MSERTAIVVGGGVVGLSTAYHLARRDFGRVLLLEKGRPGDGASSRAAGIITGLMWSETGVQARKASLGRFRELSLELDGYRFRDVGCLNLFDAVSWPEREKLLPLYDRLKVEYEVLDLAQMKHRWPELAFSGEIRGLYDPLGGYSEPDEYIPALARKCVQLGVEIRQGCQVTGFLEDAGRVAGVETTAGKVEGDAVVCATHVWTRKVMERLGGWQLPVKAFVHQRYLTEPLAAEMKIPVVNANPYGCYFRPATGGRLLVGVESVEREEFRPPSAGFDMLELRAPDELRDRARRDLLRLVPAASGAPLTREEKVGLLAFSLDGEPILGRIDALPGLFVGTAFHSGGFAYNPVAGMLLAELVADGVTSIDVSAFSPDRFEAGEVADFTASSVTQGEYAGIGGRRRH